MRTVRKLVLLAAMAMTAMALFATSASAQVRITDEETGLPCGTVSLCEIEAHSELPGTVITAHLLNGVEVVTSICSDEFEARIDHDGEGQLVHQVLAGANCPNKPCEATAQGTGDGDPWPIHIREVGPNAFVLHAVFCLQPNAGGTDRNCEITVAITDNGNHHYEFRAIDQVCGGDPPPAGVRAIEVDGHWETEEHTTSAHTDVEIGHL